MAKSAELNYPIYRHRNHNKAKSCGAQPKNFLPIHGGDIYRACEYYGIEVEKWLDLSTGINPYVYDVGDIPLHVFANLPYASPEFHQAVQHYYGHHAFSSANGTQPMIELLPTLLANYPILLPDVGYKEHQDAFERAGFNIHYYPALCAKNAQNSHNIAISKAIHAQPKQHLLIINPNNPTGLTFSAQQIKVWASYLAEGAYVIVDEAFIDLTPNVSLLRHTLPHNVIVLRSFGKFFGLAGVRLGFAFAHEALIEKMNAKLGLWQVNSVAQFMAENALKDEAWQAAMRETLSDSAEKMRQRLAPLLAGLYHSGSDLFLSYLLQKSDAFFIANQFGSDGILVRVIEVDEQQALLRIGLCKETHQNDQRIRESVSACVAFIKKAPKVE